MSLLVAPHATASTRIAADVPIYDVAFTPDGLYAYAVGYNSNDAGKLYKITLATNTSEQLLSALFRPSSVAVTADGARVLIGGYGVIYQVDPTSINASDFAYPPVASAKVWVDAGWDDIGGLAVSTEAAYAVRGSNGALARITKSGGAWPDANTGWSQIWAGPGSNIWAQGIAVTADDSTLLISAEGSEIYKLTNARTCGGSCTPTTIPGTNQSGSHGIAISPDGSFAYYARANQASFRRLDLVTNAVSAISGDGGSGTRDVAISADGAFAYLAYRGEFSRNPTILKVRTSDNTVISSVGTPLIPCNSYPWAIAASPSTSTNSDAVLVAGRGYNDSTCAALSGAVYRFPTTAAAPTSLNASAGDSSATITFTAGSDGFSTITNYRYSTDNGATFTALSPDDTTSPVTIPGLTNGTTYQVVLQAVNSSGPGTASSAVSVTPRTTPGAPTGVNGSAGDAQVGLSWTAPSSDGGSAITGYAIEQSTDGTNWSTSVADTGSTAVNHTVTGLTNGTGYYFRVSAINAAGSGTATASTSVTPRTVPGAPTSVTATAGDAQASVSWNAPVSNGGAAITAYTATASPGGAVCTTASTSCTVTGLANGTSYTFTVTATNAAGPGAASASSSAVTPQASPTPRPPRPTPTPTPTPTPSPTPAPTPTPSPTPSPTPTPTPTPTEKSLDGVVIPAPDGYSGLPPAPVSVSTTTRVREGTRVEVVLPEGAAGISVQGTVVTVRDRDGRVAARVTVTTPAGEIRADVQVPYVGPGFTVTAYNINANGVSPGASITSPLVRASTMSSTPGQRYIGTRVGRPIAFAKGSARLDAGDKAQLRATATRLTSTLGPVYVTGHAGSERGAESRLSLQRARTVAQYLSSQGVRVWIRFDGIGDQFAKGRPSDRRAEIRAT